jgi:hypothetical protein
MMAPLDRLLTGKLLGGHEEELDLLPELLQALFSLTLGHRRVEGGGLSGKLFLDAVDLVALK